jgi:glycosyltransferase involved in cell wall biosynthesis
MRIAVVLHVAASGGISRFAYALVDGLLAADPSAEIAFFVQETLVELDALDQHFADMPVEIVPIKDSAVAAQPRQAEKPEGQKSLIWRVGRDVLKKWPALHRASIEAFSKSRSRLRGEKHWSMFSMPSDVVARLDSYDVVYLALPLWIEPFQTKAAVVGTFHDLNYRAFPENFSEADYRKWDSDFRYWSDRAEIVVASTRFIKDELVAAFPDVEPKVRVIYLAPYSVREVSAEQKDATLSRFGLVGVPFVLYPANITRHKNLKTYVEAAAVLRARMGSSAPKFVIAGIGTDSIAREATSVYVRSIQDVLHSAGLVLGRDVLALGYVSDAEIDALTQSAALLVSASLYEAGCGPAMDAWKSGVPVAFSNIAPFLEQIEVLGVDALTFDPLNPESIADAVERALLNPEAMREMAVRSERAISSYTWAGVGRQYLEAFAEAAKARSDASIGRERREPEPSNPML